LSGVGIKKISDNRRNINVLEIRPINRLGFLQIDLEETPRVGVQYSRALFLIIYASTLLGLGYLMIGTP